MKEPNGHVKAYYIIVLWLKKYKMYDSDNILKKFTIITIKSNNIIS